MTNTKLNTGNRIFGLDVLRALAILFVVVSHGGFLIEGTAIQSFPYVRMIDGVDLFFVLSGFLIGGILLKQINNTPRMNWTALLSFWKRRWFRTLPNYYLILIANYFFAAYHINTTDATQFNFKFFLFLQNFTSPFSGFFWESWSLSIEEWFYIFTPLLLSLTLLVFKPKRAFLITTMAMIIIPSLFRVYNVSDQLGYWQWDIGVRKMVLSRLDSIGYGLLAAWLCYYYNGFWKKSRWYTLMAGVGLIYLVTHYKPSTSSFYQQVLIFSFSSLAAMFLLPMAHFIKRAHGYWANAITHISKISYSMYLLHFGIIVLTIKKQFAPIDPTYGIWLYLLYWFLVIFLSSLLYRYFELPMMSLRDRKFRK